jgi:hypothetical protein
MLGGWWPGQLNFVWRCLIFSEYFFFKHEKGISSHGLNQVASDNSKVHGSFQDCGSSVQNFLHVICLLQRIWRWLQDFGKWIDPCTYYLICDPYVVGKVLLYQIFSHEMYFIYIRCAEIVSDMNLFFHTNKFLPSNQCPHQSSLLGTSYS